jgi:carboxyl-terminal processing protease
VKIKYSKIIYGVLIVVLSFLGAQIENMLQSRQDIPEMEKFNKIIAYISTYYVDDVDWEKAFQSSIEGIISELDPHSVYISPADVQLNEENFQGHYEGIGIQFDIIADSLTVIAPMAGAPAAKVGMMPGDRIIAIDSVPAIGISRDEVIRRLKGPKGSTVNVDVVRRYMVSPIHFKISRDEIPITSINTSFILRDEIGYVNLNRFAQNTDRELDQALKRLNDEGMKYLILDLRGNAGGYLDQAVKIAAKFIDGDKMIVETRGRIPAFNEIYYTGDFGERTIYNVPLIVLINYGSASASEIVAGAIQDYDRGLLAGTTSFGKGLVQREYPLPDNSRLRLTISKYYTPSGRLIQRPYEEKTLQEYFKEDKQDTSKTDTLVFYTVAGRKVFGRGGITPDTLLQQEIGIAGEMIVELNRDRIFFEVATEFAASNQDLKNKFEWYVTSFQPQDELLRQIIRLANSKGITIPQDRDGQITQTIAKRLKIEIARSLWDSERYYQVAMSQDSLVLKAGTLFHEAIKITESVDRVEKRN